MLTLFDLRLGLNALSELAVKGKDAAALAQSMDHFRYEIAALEAAAKAQAAEPKPKTDLAPEKPANGEGHVQ